MPTTPVGIAALTKGVIDRLTANATGYAVEDFPEKPESYRLNNQKGAFLVAYRGADYIASADVDAIVQDRIMAVDVVVQCRQINGAGGVYTMLELASAALLGWKIAGFTKLSLVRERFTAKTEAVWIYTATFFATTLAVELDDDETGPAIARLTMSSSFNTSEIPNA